MVYFDSPDAMQAYAQYLTQKHHFFLLNWVLGAGKTTFVKGIAEALHLDPQEIQSPTYTYLHVYEDTLLHIDMRRIETEEQFLSLDILDMMQQYPYIAIERPKRTQHYASPDRFVVTIEKSDDAMRKVIGEPYAPAVLDELSQK